MDDLTNETMLDFGTLLGRHQAFGLIANRCSAADAECLKLIRDGGEFKKLGLTWEEFCQKHGGVSRVHADRLIHYLEEFGANYFRMAELMQISAETFRLISEHIGVGGMEFNGEQIPINRDNRRKIQTAVQTLRADAESPGGRPLKISAARKRLDAFFTAAHAIAETPAQRAELIALVDHGLEQLTKLAVDLRRNTIVMN